MFEDDMEQILPVFGRNGDLPPGIYRVAMQVVASELGSPNPRRIQLQSRLERIYGVAWATNRLRRFIVYGSFVTAKSEPNDIDVFMVMEDDFDSAKLTGEARILFDHGAAQAHFGASVFWVRSAGALGGEDETIAYWQTTRDGGQRGIIEIVGESI